jgi:hypothetical protein
MKQLKQASKPDLSEKKTSVKTLAKTPEKHLKPLQTYVTSR